MTAIERRVITALFADLVGFTSLSETLDPEDVASVQDAYFATVRDTVGRYGGTLEKFIGDAAVAVFGVPRARDDDAERAVRTGLALVSGVEQLAVRVGLEDGTLRVRVGVNTGEVVHAGSGPDAGRVTGDMMNVTARLQAAAAPGQVLVGETTALAVADAIHLEDLGRLVLKGKALPVRAFAATGVLPRRSRDQAMGRLRAPMLGRDRELAGLSDAFQRVGPVSSARWLFVAPPGVGKSRLLEEFALRAGEHHAPLGTQGRPVVWRARHRPEVTSPYDPVAQLMLAGLASTEPGAEITERRDAEEVLSRRLSQGGVSPARVSAVIDETLAAVWPQEDRPAVETRGPDADRESRFAAWLDALDALAGPSAQIWLVEDAHWAGGDMLAFLDLAGRRAAPYGRLVICTARPSLLERVPDWCREDAGAGRFLVHLAPLSAVDAAEVVRSLVGDCLPHELVSRIAERSGGNPLFIEELLRTWISVGTLVEIPDGGWELAAPVGEVMLPATVQAIYAAQIDDLPPAGRQATRRASVAGRRFPLAALEPLGVGQPASAVDQLRARALVTGPDADPLAGPSYTFRHVLLRDAGYASLARAERARLHVRMAGWLEGAAGARAGEVAEVIAHHYASALSEAPSLSREVAEGLTRGDAARIASDWFEAASEAALAVAAHDAARTHLRRALDLTPKTELLHGARRWSRLGEITAYAADMDEGVALLETAYTLYGEALQTELLAPEGRRAARGGYARTVATLGMVLCEQAQFERAIRLADEGLAQIGEGTDAAAGRLHFLRGWATYCYAFAPRVRADLDRALELARADGDRRLELDVLNVLTSIVENEGRPGHFEELTAMDHQIETLAGELRDWTTLSKGYRRAALRLLDEKANDAWPILDQAADLAHVRGLTEEQAWIDYARAEAGLIAGEWERAWQAGSRAMELGLRNAYHRPVVRTWFVLVPMAVAQGKRETLERAHRWFEERRAALPQSPYGRFMHTAMDLRFAQFGLRPTFVPDIAPLLAVFDEIAGLPSWFCAVETVVEAFLRAGEAQAARVILDRLAPWNDHPAMSDFGRGIEAMLRARLFLADSGGDGEVEEWARKALRGFRACRAPWWVAKTVRILETIGRADDRLAAERRAIEGMLLVRTSNTRVPGVSVFDG